MSSFIAKKYSGDFSCKINDLADFDYKFQQIGQFVLHHLPGQHGIKRVGRFGLAGVREAVQCYHSVRSKIGGLPAFP